MSERSWLDLGVGIFVISVGALYDGIELYHLIEFGEHTEYFSWWVAALMPLVGGFFILQYCSTRLRRFSKAVGENIYFKSGMILLSLGFGVLGLYVAVTAGFDLGNGGSIAALGGGVVYALIGFGAAGKTALDSELV